MNSAFGKGIRLKLFRLLKEKSELTQRDMNRKMSVSLGKINYCISVFVRKGFIKVEKFKKTEKKSAYIYNKGGVIG